MKKPPRKPKSIFKDDISITHTIVNGKQQTIKKNRIINNLMKKLSRIEKSVDEGGSPVDLEMDKIKNMYISYDSAKLTCNIVNIDL